MPLGNPMGYFQPELYGQLLGSMFGPQPFGPYGNSYFGPQPFGPYGNFQPMMPPSAPRTAPVPNTATHVGTFLPTPEQKMAMDQPQTQPVAPPIRPRNVFQQGAPGGKYLTPQARRKRDMVMALLASPTPALPVTKTRTYSAMRV